jgi:hypothetical protein
MGWLMISNSGLDTVDGSNSMQVTCIGWPQPIEHSFSRSDKLI